MSLCAFLALVAEEEFRSRFRFLHLPADWILWLVILPGIFFFSYVVYRKENLSTSMRRSLVFLRASTLIVLVLILFRPVIERVEVVVQRAKLIFLLDDSASMQRKDSYPEASTRQAISKACKLAENQQPGDFNRAELMGKALQSGLLDRIRSRFEVELYRFSTELAPVLRPEEVHGRGESTRIGDALSQSIESQRGQFLKGIVLLSDGQSNEGMDIRDAGQRAGQLGIPIYSVGIGDATTPKNLSVTLVEAPRIGLEGDEITVTARIHALGYRDRSASLSLENEDTREILSEESTVLEEGEGKRISLSFTPTQSGEYRLAVRVPPLPEETLQDDNAVFFTLSVRPEKVRVLYVEGRPRYEYRYLKNTLLRADRNIVVQCFLLSANYDFPQESTKGTPSLTTVPVTSQELTENYDVIILGDVNPFEIARTQEQCNEFLRSLKTFVEKGGGFLMIAGEEDSPRSYANTPVEDLLPVILSEGEEDWIVPGLGATEFHPQLENPSFPNEICRLHREPEMNRRLWEDADGLQGMYWYLPVRKAKPAAEVLLRHPENKNQYGQHVLSAVSYYPEGRTMYVGFDESWRWRFIYGETYFERFWRNAIRYLALNKLREGNRRFSLSSERSHYELNERAVMEARILDEGFAPSRASNQKIWIRFPDQHQESQNLDLIPSQPGTYRGSLLVGSAGSYEVWISEGDDAQGKKLSSIEFQASIPSKEQKDLNLNAANLQALAKASGGHYVALSSLSDLDPLLPESSNIEIPVLPPAVSELWDNGYMLGLLVLLLATEWLLRKKALLI